MRAFARSRDRSRLRINSVSGFGVNVRFQQPGGAASGSPRPSEADLFVAAKELTDADRRRHFLDRACRGDPALRQRVEELLAIQAQADQFFNAVGGTLTYSDSLLPLVKEALAAGGRQPLLEETIGSRLGRYKLLKKIGQGGCGAVFLAEQEEPVRRQVALKIIRVGMDSSSVVARFKAERQALAIMDHPNIARVFDAGATEAGRPYFVMELVKGIRLTDYCDQNRLNVRDRLILFVQVCLAIQHAHQKGIIHGDVKPSNIIVSLHDGEGVPKVIDFGISHAMEAGLSERSAQESPVALLGAGTPAYMSPEQARKDGLDIDTRSDIYSLGVLLHELLTGRTPFDGKKLSRAGAEEMQRTLRETEPSRASACLEALSSADRDAIAERRLTDPPTLLTVLRRDLDWVILRALAKDRARRYETANGLAMDIQRYLENEPVLARPPARLYRLEKLVRRNRGTFAAGGVIALLLVAGFGVSTRLFFREREARQRAVAAERQEARLRRQAEVREKITEAALLVREEKFEEADGLLQRLRFSEPSVEGAAALRAVGTWHALQGHWRPAADRFALLSSVNGLDTIESVTLDPLRYGPALIELGESEAYARFREELVARYARQPGRFAADRIVRVSLLLPGNSRLIESLNPLAEAMIKSFEETHAAGDSFNASWLALAVAIWEYRQDNFSGALAWSRRVLSYRDATNAPRTAITHLMMALAYARMELPDEARGEFEEGRKMVEAKYQTRLERGTPRQGFWFDWTYARIFLREVEASIEALQTPL